jgi:predicted GIY-YIG superfamily endonuclease
MSKDTYRESKQFDDEDEDDNNSEDEEEDSIGYGYLLNSSGTEDWKYGFTDDVKKRVATLQTGNGRNIIIMKYAEFFENITETPRKRHAVEAQLKSLARSLNKKNNRPSYGKDDSSGGREWFTVTAQDHRRVVERFEKICQKFNGRIIQ